MRAKTVEARQVRKEAWLRSTVKLSFLVVPLERIPLCDMKIQNMFSSNDWVFGQPFLEAEMVEDQQHGNCTYCYQVGPLGWVCKDCTEIENRVNAVYTLRYTYGYNPGTKCVINPNIICRAHRNQQRVIRKTEGESLAPDAESVPIIQFPKPNELLFFQNLAFIKLITIHDYGFLQRQKKPKFI